MVEASQSRPKTEKELKKEAEKAAKLAKFEEKQKKLAEQKAAATAKPAKEVRLNLTVELIVFKSTGKSQKGARCECHSSRQHAFGR